MRRWNGTNGSGSFVLGPVVRTFRTNFRSLRLMNAPRPEGGETLLAIFPSGLAPAPCPAAPARGPTRCSTGHNCGLAALIPM